MKMFTQRGMYAPTDTKEKELKTDSIDIILQTQSNTITFTGLKGKPKAFCVGVNAAILSPTDTFVMNVIYTGFQFWIYYCLKLELGGGAGSDKKNSTWNYDEETGTLTINSYNGIFKTKNTYQLVYTY